MSSQKLNERKKKEGKRLITHRCVEGCGRPTAKARIIWLVAYTAVLVLVLTPPVTRGLEECLVFLRGFLVLVRAYTLADVRSGGCSPRISLSGGAR